MSGDRRKSEAPAALLDDDDKNDRKQERARYLDMRTLPPRNRKPFNPDADDITLIPPVEVERLKAMNALAAKKLGSEGGDGGDGETPRGPDVKPKSSHESGAVAIDPTDIKNGVLTREALERAFDDVEDDEDDEFEDDEGEYNSLLNGLPPPEYKEGVLRAENLREAGKLLQENTLEAHREATFLLRGDGLVSDQGWERVHTETDPDRKHELSDPANETENPLAHTALQYMNHEEGSEILELGCGTGKDIFWMAERSKANFTGVDASQTVIDSADEKAAVKGVSGRTDFGCHNFMDVLEVYQGLGVDGVYMCSTGHYDPPLVAKEKFRMVAGALRPGGIFCLAMKVAESASAQASTQERLIKEKKDPYNSSVDTIDKMYRIYPETFREIIALLEPYFNIIDIERVEVEGYDKKGEVEVFYNIVATPSKLIDMEPKGRSTDDFEVVAA